MYAGIVVYAFDYAKLKWIRVCHFFVLLLKQLNAGITFIGEEDTFASNGKLQMKQCNKLISQKFVCGFLPQYKSIHNSIPTYYAHM